MGRMWGLWRGRSAARLWPPGGHLGYAVGLAACLVWIGAVPIAEAAPGSQQAARTAAFVGQTFGWPRNQPVTGGSIIAGERVDMHVVMRNTGTETWTSTSGHRLAVLSDAYDWRPIP